MGAKEQSGRTWSSFHLTRGTLVYRRISSRRKPNRRPGFAGLIKKRHTWKERLVPEDFFKTEANPEARLGTLGRTDMALVGRRAGVWLEHHWIFWFWLRAQRQSNTPIFHISKAGRGGAWLVECVLYIFSWLSSTENENVAVSRSIRCFLIQQHGLVRNRSKFCAEESVVFAKWQEKGPRKKTFFEKKILNKYFRYFS